MNVIKLEEYEPKQEESVNIRDTVSDDDQRIKENQEGLRDYPEILDAKVEKFIYEEVKRRNILKFGHFLLNDECCARDWM